MTHPVVLAGHAVLVIGSIAVTWVLLWGFKEVWVYYKQGKYWMALKWYVFEVNVPQDAVQTPMGMVNFFTNIAGSKSAITWKEGFLNGKFQAYFCLEIVSNSGEIKIYVRVQQKYIDLFQASLYAQYPEASIIEVEDYVDMIPTDYPNEEYDLFGSEIVLRKPDYLPIKTFDLFEHQGEKDLRFKDPMLGLFESLGKMRTGEHYWMQILIMQPDEQDWRKDGIKFMNELYGKTEKKKKGWFSESFGWLITGAIEQTVGMVIGGGEEEAGPDDFRMFKITPEERDQIDAVQRKVAGLGWATTIRFVYWAKKDVFRKGTIASMTKGYFHQFAHLSWNKMGIHRESTTKDDYFWQRWQMPMKQKRIAGRYQSRSFSSGSTPFILNCEELATLFHFPPADARTPVLSQITSRLAEAPQELTFAGEDVPTLPNFDAPPGAEVEKAAVRQAKVGPLATPSPTAPTGQPRGTDSAPLHPTLGVVRDAPPLREAAQPSSVQSPSVATGERMPQVGMPAPLPPGLDLADEPIESANSPENLPT